MMSWLDQYLETINKDWPEHDRTSCSDTDLANSGGILSRHRCERCEALTQWNLRKMLSDPKWSEFSTAYHDALIAGDYK